MSHEFPHVYLHGNIHAQPLLGRLYRIVRDGGALYTTADPFTAKGSFRLHPRFELPLDGIIGRISLPSDSIWHIEIAVEQGSTYADPIVPDAYLGTVRAFFDPLLKAYRQEYPVDSLSVSHEISI